MDVETGAIVSVVERAHEYVEFPCLLVLSLLFD